VLSERAFSASSSFPGRLGFTDDYEAPIHCSGWVTRYSEKANVFLRWNAIRNDKRACLPGSAFHLVG
jgi:hypothetical protein